MSFHPIRDIILAFLAGCLGFAAKGQGPSGVAGVAGAVGVSVDIVVPNAQARPFASGGGPGTMGTGGPGGMGMGGPQEMGGKKSNSNFHNWYVEQWLPEGM